MVIIDFSPVMVSQAMGQAGSGDNGEENGKFLMDENVIRHMALNSIRRYVKMFRLEYGPEIVIALDSNEKYWREEFFPYYKKNRIKARATSKFDWTGYQNAMGVIREEIKKYLPYKTIDVPNAEADDIIATLVQRKSIMPRAPELPENIMIVSGDKDFIQLQARNQYVKQYAPVQQKYLDLEDMEYGLDEHIIRGDSSDGIPNCLSDDDTFMNPDKRQVIMNAKRFEVAQQLPQDHHGIQRNRQLIDFAYIPDDIRERINTAYNTVNIPNRNHLLTYFMSKRVNLIDVLSDF
jgi:hypothetical protein